MDFVAFLDIGEVDQSSGLLRGALGKAHVNQWLGADFMAERHKLVKLRRIGIMLVTIVPARPAQHADSGLLRAFALVGGNRLPGAGIATIDVPADRPEPLCRVDVEARMWYGRRACCWQSGAARCEEHPGEEHGE